MSENTLAFAHELRVESHLKEKDLEVEEMYEPQLLRSCCRGRQPQPLRQDSCLYSQNRPGARIESRGSYLLRLQLAGPEPASVDIVRLENWKHKLQEGCSKK